MPGNITFHAADNGGKGAISRTLVAVALQKKLKKTKADEEEELSRQRLGKFYRFGVFWTTSSMVLYLADSTKLQVCSKLFDCSYYLTYISPNVN